MLPVDQNNHPQKTPPLIDQKSLSGILMVGAFIDQTITSLFGENTPPIILVDGYSDTGSYDMVVSDNFGAAFQAVEHLLCLGHRQIGLVGGEANSYPSINERRYGYFRALKDHDLTNHLSADFNIYRSQGESETAKLLQEHPEITALFCVNDNVALGAMNAARHLNLAVPEDLSIIGYDDTYLATSVSPTLTTMHVDTLAMGRAAIHLLALRIEKPDAARITLTIHPTLIERETTSPLQN